MKIKSMAVYTTAAIVRGICIYFAYIVIVDNIVGLYILSRKYQNLFLFNLLCKL